VCFCVSVSHRVEAQVSIIRSIVDSSSLLSALFFLSVRWMGLSLSL
jgi:hypothetical protein